MLGNTLLLNFSQNKTVRLVIISDTHGRHNRLYDIPAGDVLIHCGDLSINGKLDSVELFAKWFYQLPHKRKIFIAGNHDFVFEKGGLELEEFLCSLPPGIDYLEDSGVEINGIKFWGSPVQPVFFNWAFNRSPERIAKHWDAIPRNTNVLITHGPAHGILDQARRVGFPGYEHAGCRLLRANIGQIKPILHCFGHIHCAAGVEVKDGTFFANASSCDENYSIANKPIVVDIVEKRAYQVVY